VVINIIHNVCMSLVCFVYNRSTLHHMSASSLSAAQRIKCISSFSEAEILIAITNLKNEDQKACEKLTKQLIQNLEAANIPKVSLPKKRRKWQQQP
jgi:hypothetical protein